MYLTARFTYMQLVCLAFAQAQQPTHMNGLLYLREIQETGPCTFFKLQPQGNRMLSGGAIKNQLHSCMSASVLLSDVGMHTIYTCSHPHICEPSLNKDSVLREEEGMGGVCTEGSALGGWGGLYWLCLEEWGLEWRIKNFRGASLY